MKSTLYIITVALIAVCIQMGISDAYAIGADEAINIVGGNLPQALVGENIGGVLTAIVKSVLPLINLIAILVLVITGIILIISQDDNQISTARKTLISVAFSLVGINIAGPLAIALSGGFTDGIGGQQSATIISKEILGFISFIEIPIASIAVIMIVISGIRAITTFGTEQGTTHLKRSILAITSGLIIISAKISITIAIGANPFDVFLDGGTVGGPLDSIMSGGPNSQVLVDMIINIVKTVVGFMALASVIVIVTAGIMLVANKGDQDVAEKARNLIFRTIIGLFVILISYGLAMIVL